MVAVIAVVAAAVVAIAAVVAAVVVVPVVLVVVVVVAAAVAVAVVRLRAFRLVPTGYLLNWGRPCHHRCHHPRSLGRSPLPSGRLPFRSKTVLHLPGRSFRSVLLLHQFPLCGRFR